MKYSILACFSLSVLVFLLPFGLLSTAMAACPYDCPHGYIPIAEVMDLSGPYGSLGAQMNWGAEMAVRDLNEKGGVLGFKVKLFIEDDKCTPTRALKMARKLVMKEHIAFVIGHLCSGASISASKFYEKNNVLMISPAAGDPKLTDEGGINVFRVSGRYDQQGVVAGSYIVDRFFKERVAIIHDDTVYGKVLADTVKKEINKRGKMATIYYHYPVGYRDFSALISKMKAQRIALMFVGGQLNDVGTLVRQSRKQKMRGILMSGDALATEKFWEIAGEYAEGTLITSRPDPANSPAAKDIVDEVLAKALKPDRLILYTYATIQAWAEAVKIANSGDMVEVAKALKHNYFDTVLGKINFDNKGDVVGINYEIYEWRKNKLHRTEN